MELRSIFKLADDKSLILGDELCSGTETMSAISIVSKSLDILSKKKSSYMITSHLHQLTDIPLVDSIVNLDIYHLKIKCEGGDLIYDRKLCKGSGPPIYGLKVCEAMGLSEDFIKGSNEILDYITQKKDKILSTKKSQYSSKVFMDECKICKSTDNLESHHIKEQQTADDNNMIDHHHKNNKHNIVPLCKQCHDKVTYGSLVIYGWKSTSRGKSLDYEFKTIEKNKSRKYSDEQIEIIAQYKQLIDSGNLNKKTCLNMIDSEYGFRPSMKVFNDILNGEYKKSA
jgi:DNA mismatch repair protein MutS